MAFTDEQLVTRIETTEQVIADLRKELREARQLHDVRALSSQDYERAKYKAMNSTAGGPDPLTEIHTLERALRRHKSDLASRSAKVLTPGSVRQMTAAEYAAARRQALR